MGQTPPFTHASVAAGNPARYAPCCVHGRGWCMRVEAESTSSHGAAIVAFEASGLRALSSSFERNGCNGFGFVLEPEPRVAYWEPFRNHSRKQTNAEPLGGLHTGNHSGTIRANKQMLRVAHSEPRPMERQTHASTQTAAVRRSERLVAALAPPSVSTRLVRCAGHCWPSGSNPASRATRTPGTRTHGRVAARSTQPRATRSAM